MFENAPAQLFVAGPPSYRQLIGEKGRKTLTQCIHLTTISIQSLETSSLDHGQVENGLFGGEGGIKFMIKFILRNFYITLLPVIYNYFV